jgi:hypothetical protein
LIASRGGPRTRGRGRRRERKAAAGVNEPATSGSVANGQGRGQRGGGRIAALLGEARVAHQVQKAHRRDPPGTPKHAGPFELVLDVLDQVLGPRQLLLPAVTGHERTVHQRREVAAQLGGLLHGGPLVGAGGQQRQLDRAW